MRSLTCVANLKWHASKNSRSGAWNRYWWLSRQRGSCMFCSWNNKNYKSYFIINIVITYICINSWSETHLTLIPDDHKRQRSLITKANMLQTIQYSAIHLLEVAPEGVQIFVVKSSILYKIFNYKVHLRLKSPLLRNKYWQASLKLVQEEWFEIGKRKRNDAKNTTSTILYQKTFRIRINKFSYCFYHDQKYCPIELFKL